MKWHTLFSYLFYPKSPECRDKGSPPIAGEGLGVGLFGFRKRSNFQ